MTQKLLLEEGEVEIVKNKKKATIEISLCEYDDNSEENLKNWREKNIPIPKIKGFAVDFNGHNEGSGSPCKDEEEVKKEIQSLKIKYGGKYKLELIDKRKEEVIDLKKDSDWNEINEIIKRCKDKEEYAYLFIEYIANPTLESRNEYLSMSSTHQKLEGQMGSGYGGWGWTYDKDKGETPEKLMESLLDNVRSKAEKPYHPTLEGIGTTTLLLNNFIISFSKKAKEYLISLKFDFKKYESELKKIKQLIATKEDIKKTTTFILMEKHMDKLRDECWAIRSYFDEHSFLPTGRKSKNYYDDKLKELKIDTSDLNKLKELYIKKAKTYKFFYSKVYMQRWGKPSEEEYCYP